MNAAIGFAFGIFFGIIMTLILFAAILICSEHRHGIAPIDDEIEEAKKNELP
jgi:hypothetical protein